MDVIVWTPVDAAAVPVPPGEIRNAAKSTETQLFYRCNVGQFLSRRQ